MITLTCIVPFVQILTSAPAVLTAATVHLLHVQTQWDPLVVHVTVLTVEMVELAIYCNQVINRRILRRCPFTRPLFGDGKTCINIPYGN